jgi:hypothetical protein
VRRNGLEIRALREKSSAGKKVVDQIEVGEYLSIPFAAEPASANTAKTQQDVIESG